MLWAPNTQDFSANALINNYYLHDLSRSLNVSKPWSPHLEDEKNSIFLTELQGGTGEQVRKALSSVILPDGSQGGHIKIWQ